MVAPHCCVHQRRHLRHRQPPLFPLLAETLPQRHTGHKLQHQWHQAEWWIIPSILRRHLRWDPPVWPLLDHIPHRGGLRWHLYSNLSRAVSYRQALQPTNKVLSLTFCMAYTRRVVHALSASTLVDDGYEIEGESVVCLLFFDIRNYLFGHESAGVYLGC